MEFGNSEQKCSSCEVGRHTFLLDNREVFCPYICHNRGDTCVMYTPMQIRKNFELKRSDFLNED